MTKEEKIQEAYGEYWDLFNGSAKQCAFNNNGWISPILEHAPKDLDLDFGEKFIYRPKSLQGIEDNNGWIKIESEEDLSNINDEDFYYCGLMDKNGNFHERKNSKTGSYVKHESSLGYINRYQPIQKPKPPIY